MRTAKSFQSRIPAKAKGRRLACFLLAALFLASSLGAAGLASCNARKAPAPAFDPPPATKVLDEAWYKRRFTDSARLWDQGMGAFKKDFSGYFQVNLDRKFKPADGPISAVSQSRAIYMNVEAFRASGDEAFRAAALTGGDYLINSFYDEEYGGFFWLLDAKGATIETQKDAYGQVHPIFALAHLSTIANDNVYLNMAVGQYRLLKEKCVDPAWPGSYLPTRTRDFTAQETNVWNNSDVFTHWFESLLALHDVTEGDLRKEVDASIALSGDFLVKRLVRAEKGAPDRAYVAYYYDKDWNPSSKPYEGNLWDGSGYASPGHGIELAWLISRAVERGLGNESWLKTGDKLVAFAQARAIDAETGGMLFDTCAYNGAPLTEGQEFTWWPQCETARALLHYYVVRGKDDFLPAFKKVEAFIHEDFTDRKYGGLYPNLTKGKLVAQDYKGNMWKTNYHYAMFMSEAIRLAEKYPDRFQ